MNCEEEARPFNELFWCMRLAGRAKEERKMVDEKDMVGVLIKSLAVISLLITEQLSEYFHTATANALVDSSFCNFREF